MKNNGFGIVEFSPALILQKENQNTEKIFAVPVQKNASTIDFRKTVTWKLLGEPVFEYNYSVEEFIKGKRASYLRNKLIAEVFKDASIIEEYSSGLKRVTKAFAQNGNEALEFAVDEHSFAIFAKSLNKNTSQESSLKSSQKIVDLIRETPSITIIKLSEKLNLTDRAIKKNLFKLKKQGILKRIGPDKGGHWEVIKQ